jgi:small subunit ribosomal protein S6
MNRYETLLLAVPEITADEVKSIESQLDKTVTANKGTMISFERWGKYRLSYPVNKNEYGVYFLARFEGSDPLDLTAEVKNLFAVRLHDVVMRFLMNKLEEKQSLEYQRPQSLDEAPSREVESLFKESKSADSDDENNDDQE